MLIDCLAEVGTLIDFSANQLPLIAVSGYADTLLDSSANLLSSNVCWLLVEIKLLCSGQLIKECFEKDY